MIADQDSARLIIADDHPIVLQGLENLITSESAFSVVASCSDGAACMRSIRDLAPDIAVVDMAMPAMTGLEVLSCVIAERLSTKVVFLAASFSDSEIVAAARGGAYGIMLKDTVPDVCLLCLREVASGRKWLPPEFVQSALDRRTERNEQAARFHDLLTQREQEVVFLVATGLSNKAIANRLRVSEGTIKIHLHNIYKKLPVTNRTALANLANHYRETNGWS